jgi:hypothetical protein
MFTALLFLVSLRVGIAAHNGRSRSGALLFSLLSRQRLGDTLWRVRSGHSDLTQRRPATRAKFSRSK